MGWTWIEDLQPSLMENHSYQLSTPCTASGLTSEATTIVWNHLWSHQNPKMAQQQINLGVYRQKLRWQLGSWLAAKALPPNCRIVDFNSFLGALHL
jgi:hypothetical protein